MLRLSNYPMHILALASIPTCYELSKLNFQPATNLANTLKLQTTITFARTRAKALPHVVLLMPARITTLAPSTTPLGLLTMAICSSIDSSLEEFSIIFDLTWTKKFHCFWLKALKGFLSINLIYLFIYLVLVLGNVPYGCIVNIGIFDSFFLCTWFLS